MKKSLAIIALSVLVLSGCTTAPFSPPQTLIYTDFKAPLTTEFNNTDLGSKMGTSSSFSFLGLFSIGDVSISAAAKDGRIKTVKYADYSHFNILFFQKTSLFVYGD